MKNKLVTYSLLVLLIFHAVGLVLFLKGPEMANLSYLNILLCAVLVFVNESDYKKSSIPLLIIFAGGFFIEYIGITTSLLFGEYSYGDALGLKMLGVPLIIGLNWFVIVAASVNVILWIKVPKPILAFMAGFLATAMDALIEPVAMKYNFWDWDGHMVPLFNYLCWFLFASAFALIYLKFSQEKNQIGYYLFSIWLVFFGVLNFV